MRHASLSVPVLVGALAVACSAATGGPDTGTHKASTGARVATSSSVPGAAIDPGAACTPNRRGPRARFALAERSKGLDGLANDKPQDALRSLEKVLELDPSDVTAFTLHAAASANLTEQRSRAGRSFTRLKPAKLEALAPPHRATAKVNAPSVTVKALGEARHSGDWFGWLSQNGLENPVGAGGEEETPAMFGQTFGDQPVYATYPHDSYAIVRYGPSILVLGREGVGMRALQLEPQLASAFKSKIAGAQPSSVFPEARFAAVVGSTLVAELAHEGDGANVKPDGVVVGIDLATDKPLWVTPEKTGNAYAGYVTGTHYVTAWSDVGGGKLNVIDLGTGAVVVSEPIGFRADYVVGKGATIHAWGYEKAASFELSSAPPIPEARLGALITEEAGTARVLDARQRCWLDNAVIALDHRDGQGVITAVVNLPDASSAARVLRAAGEFVIARASGTVGIDLTEVPPTGVEYLPAATLRKDAPRKVIAPRRLVPAKDPVLDPPRPPFPQGPLPSYSSMRLDLFPMRYGVWNLEAGFGRDDETVLIYGRRFIVVLEKDEVKQVHDLKPLLGDAYKDLPAAIPVSFLIVVDGIVYVVVSSQGAYANGPASAYVAALDPRTGKMLWRTGPGFVVRPFQVFGDHLVAARNNGTGSELVMIRLNDGEIVQTVPLKEPIVDFGWDSRGVLYAALQKTRQYFTLK